MVSDAYYSKYDTDYCYVVQFGNKSKPELHTVIGHLKDIDGNDMDMWMSATDLTTGQDIFAHIDKDKNATKTPIY